MKSFILLFAIILVASENLRSLSYKDFNADKIYFLKAFDILDRLKQPAYHDQYVSFFVNIGMKDGAGFNKIIITTRSGSIEFLNYGITDGNQRIYSNTDN